MPTIHFSPHRFLLGLRAGTCSVCDDNCLRGSNPRRNFVIRDQTKTQTILDRVLFLDRIASQTIAACAASVALSIVHDHKNFSCLCSHLCTRLRRSCDRRTQHKPCSIRCLLRAKAHKSSSTQRPPPNERTCMGWHKRYASVFDRGSRGIYVPRR